MHAAVEKNRRHFLRAEGAVKHDCDVAAVAFGGEEDSASELMPLLLTVS